MTLTMDSKLRKTQSWNEKYSSDGGEDSDKGKGKRTLSWSEKYSDDIKQESSKIAALRQRRKSVAAGMGLPPIDEDKNIESVSRKSPSENNGREVAFNRTSRRASVAPTTSIASHWSAVSSDSNPESIFRREPWTSKPGSLNTNRRISIATRQDSFNRRGSIANMLGRRTSFRTIGGRVTTLLRAKNAFARLKGKPSVQIEDEGKVSDFEIKELPKEPRFASTLSAEAQYAIMKGYEDVVHNYLCNTYPEYRNLLRRSRTPQTGVTVKSGEKEKKKRKVAVTEKEDEIDGDEETNDDIVTSTPEPTESSPRSYLPSNHDARGSPASPRSYSTSDGSSPRSLNRTTTTNYSRNLAHYRSLPSIAPSKDRQLVMTYRYQCAMDILDNIRQQMGLQPLSPRVKTPKTTAVKEFNSWSYVWNKEFEVK